jgi:hypothetical protein
MKKLLIILTVIFLWTSKGYTSEKIYCIDLDSMSYEDFTLYHLADLNKKGNCSKDNVADSFKSKKLVLINKKDVKVLGKFGGAHYYTISRKNLEQYLKTKNFNSEINYIRIKYGPSKKTQSATSNKKLRSNNVPIKSFKCTFQSGSSIIKIYKSTAQETTSAGIYITYSEATVSDAGAYSLTGASNDPGRAWFIGALSFLILDTQMNPAKCK